MLAQNLQDRRYGYSQYHAGHAEQRAADEQRDDDDDGMEADNCPHDLRHDEVAVYLLDDDVKYEDLDRQGQVDSRSQQDSRYGSHDRSDDRNPLCNGCNQADDHGIGNAHSPHAEKGQRGDNAAHEQLAAYVAAQHRVYFLKHHCQLRTVVLRINIDKGPYHAAAVLHEVKASLVLESKRNILELRWKTEAMKHTAKRF